MRRPYPLLHFVAIATGMGFAMTAALHNAGVGFALGIGIAASMSGRPRRRCPEAKTSR